MVKSRKRPVALALLDTRELISANCYLQARSHGMPISAPLVSMPHLEDHLFVEVASHDL